MQEVRDRVKQEAKAAAKILDEYKQRLTQAIEEGGERIRKDAEEESASLLAKAREEAEQIIKEARKESEWGAEARAKILDEYRQRLTQVVEEEGDKKRKEAVA